MSAARLYRIRLHLTAPLATPLTSGTLFGHLCWCRRELEGEKALVDWLRHQEERPWLISDGFPADLLPRPLLRRDGSARLLATEEADRAKKLARLPFLRMEGFLKHRDSLSEATIAPYLAAAPESAERPLLRHRMAHNSIDRRRGTTPEEGGLFFVEEDWSFAVEARRDVYLKAAAEPGEIRLLFEHLGERGYGRDTTWGRGHFRVEGIEPLPALDAGRGSRRLSLSHGTLTANMEDVRYKLFTHFGKVGDVMAAGGARPWKKPILLVRPGATFRPRDEGPFGELLTGVHQDRPEIRHDARHLTLAFSEAES